ncbi:MAG: hypothetical protein LBQ58_08870 [Synergistaceae bacterium]|jgi:hypothetical protein|nr:hypothetical protein [Synergistaceae bacterium]
MKTINKKILSFVLALVMALGVAGFAFATGPVVGYTPDPYTELLWWADDDLSVEFTDTLVISGEPTPVYLGYNTIEIFNHVGDKYILALHPQFLPDYDDQSKAEYVLGIDSIDVWDRYSSQYVSIAIRGDTAEIPDVYTLLNASYAPYLECQVNLSLTSVKSGDIEALFWNPAYLAIPPEIFPNGVN